MLVSTVEEQLTLSEMVQKSTGQSVTPSRLKESKDPGVLGRLAGVSTISGAFLF